MLKVTLLFKETLKGLFTKQATDRTEQKCNFDSFSNVFFFFFSKETFNKVENRFLNKYAVQEDGQNQHS